MKRILTESSSYWLKDRSVKLWVGPHIHQKSFELDIDSARQLIKSHNLKFDEAMALNIFKFSRKQRNHVHVSLSGILLKEAQSLGIKLIQECSINTYDSFKHNSYRRNRFSRLHNYSYIIKHED